ncbi:MAG: polysaccharide biosynthesis C-terminal domain-containing protein, partial [Pseudomonadota bacterium]
VNSVTGILGLSVPFAGVSFVLSVALLAIERPHDNFFCALAGMIVLIAINYLAGPSLQTAAVSYVIANVVNVVTRVFCLGNAWKRRENKLSAAA